MRLASGCEQVVASPDGVEALRVGELRFAKHGVGAAVGVKLQTKFHAPQVTARRQRGALE